MGTYRMNTEQARRRESQIKICIKFTNKNPNNMITKEQFPKAHY